MNNRITSINYKKINIKPLKIDKTWEGYPKVFHNIDYIKDVKYIHRYKNGPINPTITDTAHRKYIKEVLASKNYTDELVCSKNYYNSFKDTIKIITVKFG